MTDKEKSNIQENLVKLYLRLNGYFSTGFIIHSSENKINSEIDNISIRFPHHTQNDTEHNSSAYLSVSKNIDIIISEVKSKGMKLQFNKPLHEKDCIQNWNKLLAWIGVFNSSQIDTISNEIVDLIKPRENSKLKDAGILQIVKLRLANAQLAQKKYDEALKTLAGVTEPAFKATAEEEKGDIYVAKNDIENAKKSYQSAWNELLEQKQDRQILQIKLESVGVLVDDPEIERPILDTKVDES